MIDIWIDKLIEKKTIKNIEINNNNLIIISKNLISKIDHNAH